MENETDKAVKRLIDYSSHPLQVWYCDVSTLIIHRPGDFDGESKHNHFSMAKLNYSLLDSPPIVCCSLHRSYLAVSDLVAVPRVAPAVQFFEIKSQWFLSLHVFCAEMWLKFGRHLRQRSCPAHPKGMPRFFTASAVEMLIAAALEPLSCRAKAARNPLPSWTASSCLQTAKNNEDHRCHQGRGSGSDRQRRCSTSPAMYFSLHCALSENYKPTSLRFLALGIC